MESASHIFIVGVLYFIAWPITHRRGKKINAPAFYDLAKYFLIMFLACTLTLTLWLSAKVINSNILLIATAVIPTLFLFISISYLWKFVVSFKLSRYKQFFWAIVIYGIFLAAVVMWRLPQWLLKPTLFGSSVFWNLVFGGQTIIAIGLVAICFYSVFRSTGTARKKFIWLSIAIFVGMVYPRIPGAPLPVLQSSEYISIPMFLIFVYWKSIFDKIGEFLG